MAKIYGLKAAADHVGAKSKQTVANWVANGLPHATETLGKLTVWVFDSETLEKFATDPRNRTPGPKPKQA